MALPCARLCALFSVFAVTWNVSRAFIVARVAKKEVPAECRILNHETVSDQTVPDTITVNGIQYWVYGQIQHGATSKVFHGVERMPMAHANRCVAIKVVDMNKIEPEKENQLNNEAAILHELKALGVKLIPQLYTMEHSPAKTMSMVFELAHHDLFDEITPKMGNNDHQWVRRTFYDILRAVRPVHANGFVHGDLKPENMAYFKANAGLFPAADDAKTNDGFILKPIDFGGSMRVSNLDRACEEIVTGTVMYMSPEQMAWCGAQHGDEFKEKRREHQMSEKSDVWSLGVILYQMVYGHSPYSALLHQFDAVEDETERMERADAALRPAILHGTEPIHFGQYEDEAMLNVLKKCLERCPEKRPNIDQLLALMKQQFGMGTEEQRMEFPGNKFRIHFKDIVMR
ncbi:hypothetical protein niasHT_004604 [Heterodera trifolii]|uniref:Protein kinase domain-containing protein n=1 Tax=Heterodera trifolii TaxID=157864 RepID=A0ABD2M8P9_9BILA